MIQSSSLNVFLHLLAKIFKSTWCILSATHTEFEINLAVPIKKTIHQVVKTNTSVNTNFITLAGIIMLTD